MEPPWKSFSSENFKRLSTFLIFPLLWRNENFSCNDIFVSFDMQKTSHWRFVRFNMTEHVPKYEKKTFIMLLYIKTESLCM